MITQLPLRAAVHEQLGDVPSVISIAQLPLLVAHVEVAGEAITNAVIANVGAGRKLWNNFGPTEVSVDVTGRQ